MTAAISTTVPRTPSALAQRVVLAGSGYLGSPNLVASVEAHLSAAVPSVDPAGHTDATRRYLAARQADLPERACWLMRTTANPLYLLMFGHSRAVRTRRLAAAGLLDPPAGAAVVAADVADVAAALDALPALAERAAATGRTGPLARGLEALATAHLRRDIDAATPRVADGDRGDPVDHVDPVLLAEAVAIALAAGLRLFGLNGPERL